jgi:hypothetical protein
MPLKPMHRRKDITKMDVARNSISDADWTDVVEDREKVAGSLQNDDESSGFTKYREFID